MSGLLMTNSVCQQAEQKIEAGVPPKQRANWLKIVTSGMKVALQSGGHGLMSQLHDSQDPIGDVVKGAIGIVGILRRQSQGTMPVEAMIPATMTLILQGLNYVEKSGIQQITADDVDKATHMFVEDIMPRLGVTHQKVEQMLSQTNAMAENPAKRAQLEAMQKGQDNGAA